jgi:phosphoglycerol transferase MdoB-like AlkP superfamily enzyme
MTLGEVPRSGKPDDALPPSVQFAAVLLIAQAVIRVGFLLVTLSTLITVQAASALYRNPLFVIQSIVVPAVFVVAGLVAGILVLQRSPGARSFGLVLCAVGLAYQLYAFSSFIYVAMTRPAIHFPWFSWVISPVYIAVYLTGLIIFILWRQPQTNP